MPWREASRVSLRLDFVLSTLEDDANIRALSRQYGISPTTGYHTEMHYFLILIFEMVRLHCIIKSLYLNGRRTAHGQRNL
jgi:hypothetical protein